MSSFVLAPFAACIGDCFEVVGAPGGTWTLVAADGYGTVVDAATHGAFSLSFRGATEPVFAQQIVRLTHPVLGEQAIFVVPVARDAEGVTYQAVFN